MQVYSAGLDLDCIDISGVDPADGEASPVSVLEWRPGDVDSSQRGLSSAMAEAARETGISEAQPRATKTSETNSKRIAPTISESSLQDKKGRRKKEKGKPGKR